MEYKISVIIPVYNVEPYIERCLKSLVYQTLKELEIIIVNDGSPDNSEAIILSYQRRYPNKIMYLKKENGGLSDARNYALSYATGEYIAFLDSDDYVEQDMYEQMYQATNNGRKKIVECDFFWEYSKKKKVDSVSYYTSIQDYLVRGRVVAWNKLYLRKWLIKTQVIFPKGLLYEDVGFFFSLMPRLLSINEVGYVKKAFVHYIQRQESISYRESNRIVELCQVYQYAIENLKKANLFNLYSMELEYKFARNALWGFPLKKVRFIKERPVRKKVLEIFWIEVNTMFPLWKNNVYLQKKGIANLYLRFIFRKLYYAIFML